MMKLFYIASGGAFGALARYALSGFVANNSDGDFPFGTLAVNAIGSLLIGFLWNVSMEQIAISPELRALIFTGFLGAFTTFSTYSLESANLIQAGQYKGALLNFVLNNLLALSFCFLGLITANLIRR